MDLKESETIKIMAYELIERHKNHISNQSFGNYSKSYEFYKRFSNIIKCFLQHTNKTKFCKVLDVGCGDGYHIFVINSLPDIKERTFFIGIDISPKDINIATQTAISLSYGNINFINSSIEKINFPDSTFDIVLCNDVIEHIFLPQEFLIEIFKKLKSGGILILTTPNDTSIIKRISNFIKRKKDYHGINDGHVSVKGVNEWKRILKKTGFKNIKIYRGALVYGGNKINKHPVIFALIVLLDKFFDIIPFMKNWCESITFRCTKS